MNSEAKRAGNRRYAERKRREAGIEPREVSPIKHGTTTGYRKGCRCDECREAVNQYFRARNGGTLPSSPGKYNVKPSTNGGNKRD